MAKRACFQPHQIFICQLITLLLLFFGMTPLCAAQISISTDKENYLVGESITGSATVYEEYYNSNIEISISPALPRLDYQQFPNYTYFSYDATTPGTYTINATSDNGSYGSKTIKVYNATVKKSGKQIINIESIHEAGMAITLSSDEAVPLYFESPVTSDWDLSFPGIKGPFGTTGGSQPVVQGIEVDAAEPGGFTVYVDYRITDGTEIKTTGTDSHPFAAFKLTADPAILELDLGQTKTTEVSILLSDEPASYPKIQSFTKRWTNPSGSNAFVFPGATDGLEVEIKGAAPSESLQDPPKARFSLGMIGTDIEGNHLEIGGSVNVEVKVIGSQLALVSPGPIIPGETVTITGTYRPIDPEDYTFTFAPGNIAPGYSAAGGDIAIVSPELYLTTQGFVIDNGKAMATVSGEYIVRENGYEYSSASSCIVQISPIDRIEITGLPAGDLGVCEPQVQLSINLFAGNRPVTRPSELVVEWAVQGGASTIAADGLLTIGSQQGVSTVTAKVLKAASPNDRYVLENLEDSKTKTIHDFSIDITPQNTSTYPNHPVILSASVSCNGQDRTNDAVITWSNNEVGSQAQFQFSDIGTYTITCTAQLCGEAKTAIGTINVTVVPLDFQLLIGASTIDDGAKGDDWVMSGSVTPCRVVVGGETGGLDFVEVSSPQAAPGRPRAAIELHEWHFHYPTGPGSRRITVELKEVPGTTQREGIFWVKGKSSSVNYEDIEIEVLHNGETVATDTMTCFSVKLGNGSGGETAIPVNPVIVNSAAAAIGGNLFGVQQLWPTDEGSNGVLISPVKFMNTSGYKWGIRSLEVMWVKRQGVDYFCTNDEKFTGTNASGMELAPELDDMPGLSRTPLRMRDHAISAPIKRRQKDLDDSDPSSRYFFVHPALYSTLYTPDLRKASPGVVLVHHFPTIGPFPVKVHVFSSVFWENPVTTSEITSAYQQDLNRLYSQAGINFSLTVKEHLVPDGHLDLIGNSNNVYQRIMRYGDNRHIDVFAIRQIPASHPQFGTVGTGGLCIMANTFQAARTGAGIIVAGEINYPVHGGPLMTSPYDVRIRSLAHELYHYIALVGDEAHEIAGENPEKSIYIMGGSASRYKKYLSIGEIAQLRFLTKIKPGAPR